MTIEGSKNTAITTQLQTNKQENFCRDDKSVDCFTFCYVYISTCIFIDIVDIGSYKSIHSQAVYKKLFFVLMFFQERHILHKTRDRNSRVFLYQCSCSRHSSIKYVRGSFCHITANALRVRG